MARRSGKSPTSRGRPGPPPRREPPDKLIAPQEAETFLVHPNQAGMRLDRFLKAKMRHRSRNRVQRLICEREVASGGVRLSASYRVKALEEIRVPLPPPGEAAYRIHEIPLDILYEDDDLVIVNKPPNLVVHPAGSHFYDTLLNALHLRYRDLEDPERDVVPKLAHRIDRETSGVIVANKTGRCQRGVPLVFERANVRKEYVAIAEGVIEEEEFLVEKPLCKVPGKDPNRALMVVHPEGMRAKTTFRVLERFDDFTLVHCRLHTGRQHQIRVHLQSVGHPVVCDKLYGRRTALQLSNVKAREDGEDDLLLARQALHAQRITFTHPTTGKIIAVEAPLPEDMRRTLEALRGR